MNEMTLAQLKRAVMKVYPKAHAWKLSTKLCTQKTWQFWQITRTDKNESYDSRNAIGQRCETRYYAWKSAYERIKYS